MHLKKLAICACVSGLALAIACSKQQSQSPVSPSAAVEPGTAAGADGSSLKVTTPTPVSPVDNQQPDGSLVLTATKATGKFANFPVSYEFEVFNSSNQRVYASGVVGGVGAGPDNVSHAVSAPLDFDQPYTWRVRGVFQGAVGSWSSAASFRAPAGGYIRGSEIFDPLSNGTTVGTPVGPTQFIQGKGIQLLDHSSRVTYTLPVTLEAGEMSVMVTGFDEGSPGDKSKIMSMQEGFGDITTNDYRFTAEKRGRSYPVPGAVTFRMINGDAGNHGFINDGVRSGVGFSDELWYFWKITWNNTSGSLEVRENGPSGRVIYARAVGTNGHAYRPQPHVVHLGAPVGRGGPEDATVPGAIFKNLWVSSRPRPAFPGE